MNRNELLALAARVEALTGPCRETDAAIMQAVVPPRPDCDFSWPDRPPAFTASLDAAMSLWTGGLLVAMSEMAADGLPGVCIASSTEPLREHWGIASHAAGEPMFSILARCYTAAALRARAANMENDGE